MGSFLVQFDCFGEPENNFLPSLDHEGGAYRSFRNASTYKNNFTLPIC